MASQTSQAQKRSQLNQSQAVPKNLNTEDQKKFVSDIVFFILTQEQKKAPLKRSDIIRSVGLNNQSRDVQEAIFSEATRRLERSFGLVLKELPGEKFTFILLNQLSPSHSEANHLVWSDREKAQRGLTTALLALVFMSGGMVKEDKILSFLTKLGLHGDNPNESSKDSRNLLAPGGNVKQFIDKELVSKQKYLHVEKPKSADAENPMSEYRWGSRAHAEVKKSEILKWVSKVYKCKPESFRDQFEEAKQEDPNADFDDDAERMEAD